MAGQRLCLGCGLEEKNQTPVGAAVLKDEGAAVLGIRTVLGKGEADGAPVLRKRIQNPGGRPAWFWGHKKSNSGEGGGCVWEFFLKGAAVFLFFRV